ncbi:MAG: hypothetical protein WAX77_03920 [Methylococcaceae bacterium]
MLTTLEDFLLYAIKPLLPSNVTLLTGVSVNEFNSTQSTLIIHANNLQILKNTPADNQRDSVFFTKRYVFKAAKTQSEFILPIDAQGEILEVEFMGGKLAKPHDDYWLESNKLCFYRAPSIDFSVLVRENSARGYQEIQSCVIDLWLEAYDLQRATSNDILSDALAASLAVFIDVDRLELTQKTIAQTNLIFSLRLLKPELRLVKIDNSGQLENKTFVFKVLLNLTAQLEERVIFGTAETESYIEKIEIQQQRE